MSHLLKFCYLLVIITLVSCQSKTSETKPAGGETGSSEEISVDENTGDSAREKVLVFFGNSLTAGMGLDPRESFPALIQNKLDSLNMNYSVVNAGLSGETTSGGNSRVDWVLNQKPDVFVLELGANDGLRGIPLDETRRNLQSIIDKVRNKNPEVTIVLVGMQIPPNMGPEYTSEFRKIFPELAGENSLALIPFLLEGVAGNPELNQRDGIHPTAEGQKIVAENVWKVLKDVLQ
jgi:acyl-CoA thioesterase-1